MKYWIVPANWKQFDVVSCVEDHKEVYWRQTRYRYEVGDIVFLYGTGGVGRILYAMIVEEANIANSPEIIARQKSYQRLHLAPTDRVNRLRMLKKIDTPMLDKAHLEEQGLIGNVQGSQKVSGPLLDYILKQTIKDFI